MKIKKGFFIFLNFYVFTHVHNVYIEICFSTFPKMFGSPPARLARAQYGIVFASVVGDPPTEGVLLMKQSEDPRAMNQNVIALS